jgi:hypothetical protein
MPIIFLKTAICVRRKKVVKVTEERKKDAYTYIIQKKSMIYNGEEELL